MILSKPAYNTEILEDIVNDYPIYSEPKTINPQLYIKDPTIKDTPIKEEPKSVLGVPVTNSSGEVIYYNGGNLNEVIIPKKETLTQKTNKIMQKVKDFYNTNKTYCLIGLGVLALFIGYFAFKKK